MKKVADLSGAELDYWVAKIEGHECEIGTGNTGRIECGIVWSGAWGGKPAWMSFSPSSNWSQGGPLLEKEGVEIYKSLGDNGTFEGWRAGLPAGPYGRFRYWLGPTVLIAAMRCIVASRFGETVEEG